MTTNIKIGDAKKIIKLEQDNFFDCVMTSPPYWGLRDYGHLDQIGLEPTPEKYLETMWSLFDDIKLKLKDEGNCFVNLGDTYAGSNGAGYKQSIHNSNHSLSGAIENISLRKETGRIDGIKPKSLIMIPQRFAWGMIERGWILRNEIIWHKPNHMPESVTDRLTKAHEVIYHFVKQSKYYYDLDAIREPHKTNENRPMGIIRSLEWGYNGKYEGNKLHEDFGSPRARTQRKHDGNGTGCDGAGIRNHSGNSLNHPLGKNPGDVWQINTQPYKEAHFAVFPIKLVRRPILAGCPPCGHVLDPFGGSGTVAEFCRKNDRNCTIYELNPEYLKLIKEKSLNHYPKLESYCGDKQ